MMLIKINSWDVYCVLKITLSLVDKVTIGKFNLASVISNLSESPELDKMHPSIQFKSSCIFQLINGISSDLQKLLKYFNGTTVFVFFTELFVLLTTFAVVPKRADLYLND